ncbi:ParB/RepB/Spo0J family partition protein [Brachybacterium sp. AOP25-B2-12]|uniref:ParB/RepB/Spo0J family partition protein n=1 Tax=Brachybacterium sp. AOP25-B2-12 TaxID=3457710 RepID=UPI004033C1D6
MTQKRGLGRGLGALIPGAGTTSTTTRPRTVTPAEEDPRTEPTPRRDRGSRTTDVAGPDGSEASGAREPQADAEPTEEHAAGTRPVDMFFSGDPAGVIAGTATRNRNGRDLADSMARDVAERRAAQAGSRRRTATRGTKGGTAASKAAAAVEPVAGHAADPVADAAVTAEAAGAPASPAAPVGDPSTASSRPSTSRSTTGTVAKRTSPTPKRSTSRAAGSAAKSTRSAVSEADEKAVGTGPGTDPSSVVEGGDAVEVEAVVPEPARRTTTTEATRDAAEADVRAEEKPTDSSSDGALLPVPGAEFAEIPIHEIRENPRNPRTVFDDDALDELAYSLREVGVLQPVVVRPIPATDEGESFELVMGERRWRAARRAGLASIPAIIRETSDDDLLRDALLENLHRSQLNPLEEAAAYQQLLEDFGCTQEELADRIGRSRPQITNTLRLMKLPPLVQRRLASGALSAGHSRALLGLDSPALMEELAQRIVAEGLSVRAVERLVARGIEPERARATPRRSSYDPHVVDLTSRLSNRLEAPVRIDVGKRKGRITLEFTNLEDLERLMERIGLEGAEHLEDASPED